MSNKLQNHIKKLLFEDTWNQYGSEYMSHPEDQETTVPPNLPVVPDDLMPNQLAVERPPVEDENFVPEGVEELSRSVAVLAQQVPAEQVASFYKGVHNLLDQSIAKNNDPETLTADEEKEEVNTVIKQEDKVTQESRQLKRFLKRLLKEQPGLPWDSPDPRYQKHKKDDDWEEDTESAATVKDTIKGKNIAPYFNKASPSGVQNASDRLLQGYFKAMMDVKGEEIDDSTQYLRDHFSLLTQDIENVPPEAPKAFVGMILKKAVKRGSSGDAGFDGRLLFHVVTLWKSLSPKKKADLVDAAIEETHAEMADWDKLVNTLREEDPEQYEVLMGLNLR
jgi:hypothetical protein